MTGEGGARVKERLGLEWKKRVHQQTVRHAARTAAWKVVHFILTFGLCFLVLLPVLRQISLMFMSADDVFDVTVAYLPKNFSLMFVELCVKVLDFPKTVLTTFLASFAIAAVQALSCSFIAYGLARFRFLLRGPLFVMVVLTLMVPPVVLLLPQYFLLSHFDPFGLVTLLSGRAGGLSLLNTWWPFILVSLTGVGFKNGLYIYLMIQYYKSFPVALEEAAAIDGIGTLRFYLTIAQRLALTLIATCFILAFVWQWSDIQFTMYYMPQAPLLSIKLRTLIEAASQILMPNLDSTARVRMPTAYENAVSSAGMVLGMAPLVVVYLFTQRFLTESIERTGIK